MARSMEEHTVTAHGQDHDRIEAWGYIPENGEEDGDGDVSMSQKMLSAVTGSILTSLLVTPLDVVRVRLQSQSHKPSPSPSSSALASIPRSAPTPPSQAFMNLPPNLGISTCCREVFWVNNNAPFCVASAPSISVITSTGVTAHSRAAASCAAEEMQSKSFTTTLDGLRKIARHEGPTTLWRGLSPTLAMAIPGNVIYFAGYDWLRHNPSSPFRRLGMSDDYTPLVAGSTARVLAAIAISPIEMFRTRIQAASPGSQAKNGVFRETWSGMRDMIGAQGIRSLWTGLTLTLWRDVPFSAIYWWGYEFGRDRLTNMREERRGRDRISSRNPEALRLRSRSRSQDNHINTLVDSFIAGAGSGVVAAFVTTPFDVGKTRQQVIKQAKVMGSGNGANLPEEQQMVKFLLSIFKEQGMSGLFKGWAARCLKIGPACAIMISSYEIGKKMAGGINERRDRTV